MRLGPVSGSGTNSNIGGLVGLNLRVAIISNSYETGCGLRFKF